MTDYILPEIDLGSKAYILNPNQFFKHYRQHAPLFYMEKYACWLISRHADVKTALADPVFTRNIQFSNKMEIGKIAQQWEAAGIGFFIDILTNEETHTRHRRLIHDAFKPQQVTLMVQTINEEVEHYLKKIHAGGIVDLVSVISPIPNTLLINKLGIQIEESSAEKFRKAALSIVPGLFNPYATQAMRTNAIESSLYLKQFLLEEVKKRQENPQDDLLTSFIHTLKQFPNYDEMEVVKLVLVLVFAATDTTVYSTLHAVKDLFEHPAQLNLLRSNRELVGNAVRELLRFHTAGSFFPKYALQETEYHGKKIAKGDTVFICIASANKDETVFENPEQLDITRDTREILSFGYGRHYCLGAHLAQTVMSTIFNRLLDYLPTEAQLISEQIQWQEQGGRRTLSSLPMNTKL